MTRPALPFPGQTLHGLRRPRILARAARLAARAYRPERDRARWMARLECGQRVEAALARLEAELETRRRAGDPSWRPRYHVEVLAALIAESVAPAEFAAPALPAQAKASGSEALRRAT